MPRLKGHLGRTAVRAAEDGVAYLHLSMSPLGDQGERSEAADTQCGQAVKHFCNGNFNLLR